MVCFAQAWWYRKWVWEWVEEERVMELHDAAKPTIGFHIRGGDVTHVDKAQVRLNRRFPQGSFPPQDRQTVLVQHDNKLRP